MRNIFLLLLFVCFYAQASGSFEHDRFYKKAQNVAMLSANAVYHLDQRQLPSILKPFIEQNSDIVALEVIENLEHKRLFSFFGPQEAYNIDLDMNLSQYHQAKAPVVYKDAVIGEVIVYYENRVALSPAQKKWIQKNPVISVGLEQDWAPYDFVNDNGEYSGMAHEYLQLIQQYTGLRFEYTPYKYWDDLQKAFGNNEIELLPALYKTEKRSQNTLFTSPYYSMYEYVFTQKDAQIVHSIKDLYGKKVASAKGFAITHWLKKNHPQIHIVEKMSILQCLRSVSSGESHAFIFDSSSTEYTLQKANISNIKLNTLLAERGRKSLHMGVSSDNFMLVDIINTVLQSITKEHKQQITSYWMETVSKHGIYFTEKEQLFLHQNKKISYVYDPNSAPLDLRNDLGDHVGIMSDLLQIIQDKTSLEFEPIHFDTWEESLSYAMNSKNTMVSSIAYSDARTKNLRFTTNNIFTVPVVFVEREDETRIFKTQDELIKNATVGVIRSDIFADILKKRYPQESFVEVKSPKQGYEKLLNKEIDYFVLNVITAQYYIKHKGFEEAKVSQKLDFDLKLKMASTKDMPQEFLSILDKTIASISEKKRNKIYHQWTQMSVKKEIQWALVLSIILVASLLILFFAYWNKKLHQSVAKKTQELVQLNKSLEHKINTEVEKSKKIQQQLFRSEKMAAMGEMIANIAHQWRQPLSVIASGATGMKMLKEFGTLKDEQFLQTCDMINENAQYLSHTIDDFRDFIKGEKREAIFTLDFAIEKSCHLLSSAFKNYNITLKKEIEKDIFIYSNANELIQCIINIINNASDVLKELEDEDDRIIIIKSYSKDERAYLEIVDSGGGVPLDIMDKIFDPYFTTKHQSKGTGLGLHMVYALVTEGLGGGINVENIDFEYHAKKYHGAKFCITLPIKSERQKEKQ